LGPPIAISVGVEAVYLGHAWDCICGPGNYGVEAVGWVEVVVVGFGWWLGEPDPPAHGSFEIP
jgi:hypothetical protein